MSTLKINASSEVPVVVVLEDETLAKEKPLPPVLPCFSPEGTTVEYMNTDDEEDDGDDADVLKLSGPELSEFIKEMDNTPCLKPEVLHSKGSKKPKAAVSTKSKNSAVKKTSAISISNPAADVSEAKTSGTPHAASVPIPKAFEATMKAVTKKDHNTQVKYFKRLQELLASAPKLPSCFSSFKCPPAFEIKSTFNFDLQSMEPVEAPVEPMDVTGTTRKEPSKEMTVSAGAPVPSVKNPKGTAPARRMSVRDRINPSYVRSPGRTRPVKERLGTRPVELDAALVLPVQGPVNQAELLRLNGIELAGKLRTARRRQSRTRNHMRHRGVPESEIHYRYVWSKSTPKGGEDC